MDFLTFVILVIGIFSEIIIVIPFFNIYRVYKKNPMPGHIKYLRKALLFSLAHALLTHLSVSVCYGASMLIPLIGRLLSVCRAFILISLGSFWFYVLIVAIYTFLGRIIPRSELTEFDDVKTVYLHNVKCAGNLFKMVSVGIGFLNLIAILLPVAVFHVMIVCAGMLVVEAIVLLLYNVYIKKHYKLIT